MSDERDPMRWADAASDCDPVLQRVLGNARDGLGDRAREDALARGIEQAVRARVASGDGQHTGAAQGRGLRGWLPRVGIAGVILGLSAAGWSAWSMSAGSASAGSTSAGSASAGSAAESAARARSQSASAASARVQARAPSKTGARPEHALGGAADTRIGASAPVADEARLHAVDDAAATAVLATAVPAAGPNAQDAPVPATAATVTPRALVPAHAERPGADRARVRARVAQRERAATEAAAAASPDFAARAESAASGAPARTAIPPELQLLASAQRALRASPGEALALADRHARAYPAGRFVEEREEIAITALFALGQREAGRTRARAFLSRYPRSLSAPRVATLLDGER